MLFPDLSAPEACHNNSFKSKWPKRPPLAFVSDRFLALVFDFLLLSPLLSLFIASFVKQTKTFFILDAQSPEGFIMAGLVFSLSAMFVVFFQAVCLYQWHATPGQFFFQMRVVSFPHEKSELTFSKCLLRSVGFVGSFLFLAIPFLEILGHPYRRSFHERASDTMVITLKKISDDGPQDIEEKFISSWVRTSFFMLAAFMFLSASKTYYSLKASSGASRYATSNQCKMINDKNLQGSARLDAALALFVLDEISGDCLNQEADAFLWGDPTGIQELAYVAKYISSVTFVAVKANEKDRKEYLATEAERKLYYEKICASKNSTACLLVSFLNEKSQTDLLDLIDSKLMITQVLQAEDYYDKKDFVRSLELIQKLQNKAALRSAMEKQYVRSAWALRESILKPTDIKSSGRSPASVDSAKWIDKFKEKYGIQ
jgi:hypothetical protein